MVPVLQLFSVPELKHSLVPEKLPAPELKWLPIPLEQLLDPDTARLQLAPDLVESLQLTASAAPCISGLTGSPARRPVTPSCSVVSLQPACCVSCLKALNCGPGLLSCPQSCAQPSESLRPRHQPPEAPAQTQGQEDALCLNEHRTLNLFCFSVCILGPHPCFLCSH